MGRIKASTHFLFTMDVIERVKGLIKPFLEDKGAELVDITYRRESAGMTLRLLVDKDGGITLDDCTDINGAIGNILEENDVIYEKHTIEVSSPGLDRPLKTRRDFERAIGKKIHVHTYEPVNDKRDHEGTVSSVDDEKVVLDCAEIELKKISKAKLKLEFK